MSMLLLAVSVFLLLVRAENGDRGTYCPWNGVTSDIPGYQCLVVFTDRVVWHDAVYSCEIHGGSLVKIETEEQLFYINDTIRKSGHYWIGLNDLDTEGQFVWSNRMIFEVPLENWKPRQPGGGTAQNCVSSGDNGWEDKSCTEEFKYICQIVMDMAPETNISIPKEAKLLDNRVIKTGTWNDRALMVSLSAEDESICVLYCLYTEKCVRVSYRPDKKNINCLLYRVAVGYEAPLWEWRVYERPE